jgi:hypothetical protein
LLRRKIQITRKWKMRVKKSSRFMPQYQEHKEMPARNPYQLQQAPRSLLRSHKEQSLRSQQRAKKTMKTWKARMMKMKTMTGMRRSTRRKAPEHRELRAEAETVTLPTTSHPTQMHSLLPETQTRR